MKTVKIHFQYHHSHVNKENSTKNSIRKVSCDNWKRNRKKERKNYKRNI